MNQLLLTTVPVQIQKLKNFAIPTVCCLCSLTGLPHPHAKGLKWGVEVWDRPQAFFGCPTPLLLVNGWPCFQAALTALRVTRVPDGLPELWVQVSRSRGTKVTGNLVLSPFMALDLCHSRWFSNVSSCENIFSRYIWWELPGTLWTDRKLIKCPGAQICGRFFLPAPGSLWVSEMDIPYVSCQAFRMTLE